MQLLPTSYLFLRLVVYICPCYSLTLSQLTLPPPRVLKSILYVTSSCLRPSYHLRTCMGWVVSAWLYKRVSFLSVFHLFRGLPVIWIIFWFNVYSVIKLFSFPSTFVERFSGWPGDFGFNYISPKRGMRILKHYWWEGNLGQPFWKVIRWYLVKYMFAFCPIILFLAYTPEKMSLRKQFQGCSIPYCLL